MNLNDHVTPHFIWKEALASAAASRLGLDNMPQNDEFVANIKRTCQALEIIREHFGKPIRVYSIYRCPEVNAAVGGSKTSAHMLGLAADFIVMGMSNFIVCSKVPAAFPDFDQVIYEFGQTGWVHLGLSVGAPRHQLLSATKIGGRTVYAALINNTESKEV